VSALVVVVTLNLERVSALVVVVVATLNAIKQQK
jgi:hypothetical protein